MMYTIDTVSILNILGKLVDSSLLVRQPTTDGQVRFTMLKTIREYALERLHAEHELERLQDWYASYSLRFAWAADNGLRTSEPSAWLAQLAAEQENVRTAQT